MVSATSEGGRRPSGTTGVVERRAADARAQQADA
jgi:hypothetical protein